MRALIRDDEIYTEAEWSPFTRTHLAFMTGTEKDARGKALPGDGWTLVENYVPPVEESCDVVETVTEETVTETEEETVTINGVTYTKSQLRALLGE